jgi:hypothetical protein
MKVEEEKEEVLVKLLVTSASMYELFTVAISMIITLMPGGVSSDSLA